MYARLRNNRGFSILEMVIVVLLMGMLMSMTVPRALRTTPKQEVDRAARQLARDLEAVRLRAMAAKRIVRLSFYESKGFYAAYMDMTTDRSGKINETLDEARNARLLARGSDAGIPGVQLEKTVQFGTGKATKDPMGNSASDGVALTDDRVEFTIRGMVTPIGSGGTIFLTHRDDPEAVAAVTISGSGAFRSWRYRDGEWK